MRRLVRPLQRRGGAFWIPAVLLLAARASAVPIVVPLTEDGGLAFTDCAFDGVPARCLWDSGSTRSCAPMDPGLRARPILRTEHAQDVISVRSVSVPAGDLGPAEVWLGSSRRGVLGSDVVSPRRFDVTGAPDPRLILDPPDPVPEPASPLARDGQGRLILEVMLGDRRTLALWDTGTADTRVSRDFIAEAASGDFTRVGGYNARRESGSRYRLSVFRAGGLEWKNIEVFDSHFTYDQRRVFVILGWDLIRQADWSFNARSGAWSARLRAP